MMPSQIDCEREFNSRHKPGLDDYLKAIDMDVMYGRGIGDTLFCRMTDGSEVDVLDLVGGYGVLLLGHNHPQVISAATDFLTSGAANHAQGSIRVGANRLASAIAARTNRDFCLVLANSGTEAIEAALKHALLETGGRTFVAIEGSFHGKTFGALRVTSNPQFQVPFGAEDPNIVHVPANDVGQLDAILAKVKDPAGLIFEPIQGEAGVRPLSAEFVQAAARWCAKHDVPLIADECQTGLGRTGKFLACESLGATPDYVLLSKSLGGGIAKISALLIDRRRYRTDFDLIHSSTFADDEFSCAIALRVLDLINDNTLARCQSKGDYLLDQLRSLMRRYPSVIADVRGSGLMIGVELKRLDDRAGFVLKHLTERELLGPLVASFLLNEHRVRIAPTLSNSLTLRIQPSFLIRDDQLRSVVDAMDSVCQKLDACDVAGLTQMLSRRKATQGSVPPAPRSSAVVFHYHSSQQRAQAVGDRCQPDESRHVAWIFHLIDQNDLNHLDPGLRSINDESKQNFCERWGLFSEPIVMDKMEIRSSSGESVTLSPILLPVTSEWMLKNARGAWARAPQLVQRAVDVAESIGCGVVALGQFTSIVTRCGATLDRRNRKMRVTAGSSYTVALVDQAVRAQLAQRDRDPADLVLGVVGATGDIAGTCASLLGPRFRRSILVGSRRLGSIERLESVARRIPRATIASDPRELEQANVVVCATNSTTALIGPECLCSDAIVCDASVPASMNSRITTQLPNVTFCPGAIVQLPHREPIRIPGFPLPAGYTYGCMAEGLLIAMEGIQPGRWGGRSSPSQASIMSQIGDRHGFRVARSSVDARPAEPTS